MAKNLFVSKPLKAPPRDGKRDFYRADLQLQGVDHSNASYEGRVFLNNPKARRSTAVEAENGYVGSYFIFGHAGCWGDEGHCDIPESPLSVFDLRPPHELTPQLVILPVTEQVKVLDNEAREAITVTIVAVPAKASPKPQLPHLSEDVLHFERLVLATYVE